MYGVGAEKGVLRNFLLAMRERQNKESARSGCFCL